MAGYSKIYCLGEEGGFMGADGINPIQLQIWVGDANRQWLEAHYFDEKIKPIGNVTRIFPKLPDDPNSLLDACIAFFPDHFRECPTLAKVEESLEKSEFIDFDRGVCIR